MIRNSLAVAGIGTSVVGQLSQASSSKASGSRVLLLGPEEAFKIRGFRAVRCSLSAGIISRMGKFMVKE
ncbi:hypothetical protein [Pontibacter lucknowensis]|uniref:hypothetical protein n=1 Tax=Pontibacter lucknowensis TaxID=1077936 RepID=UPI000970A772|nr:hypothetical protein [Pontibacter lucknowensis]